MAKKKKTLPKDFKDLIKNKDIPALKAVFETCELDACGGFGKGTALHFYDIPEELVRWLAEQGADVNAVDTYGKTPIYEQATIGSDIVKVLLDSGADFKKPAKDGSTPLHIAAGFFHPHTVSELVARGADFHATTLDNLTPLAEALARCRGADIARMAKVADILLSCGSEITPEMRESVTRIGKEFEFHRSNFNKDYLEETEAGLAKLYELFSVEPVARRRVHDGVSPITVTSKRWQQQHGELWDYLVPSQGKAQTVQGEVIRIAGRVSHEVLGNGGANWGADYRKMLDALLKHFASGLPLAGEELNEAKQLVERLHDGDGDEEPARLTEFAVRWVLKNPDPVPLGTPDYKR